jgi:hypothetical protein
LRGEASLAPTTAEEGERREDEHSSRSVESAERLAEREDTEGGRGQRLGEDDRRHLRCRQMRQPASEQDVCARGGKDPEVERERDP